MKTLMKINLLNNKFLKFLKINTIDEFNIFKKK